MVDTKPDYVTRVFDSVLSIDAKAWNALLAQSPAPTPFMRHEYLAAMEQSGSATAQTGWAASFVTLWQKKANAPTGEASPLPAAHGALPDSDMALVAACPMYLKTHSYGEYVFDWAWASAYQQHGLPYYPKALVAVPFTPVPGSRYLCSHGLSPGHLLREQIAYLQTHKIGTLHVLFGDANDLAACAGQQLMQRQTLQFHWENAGWQSFDAFLASLSQDKRKKIRAERRKVQAAGVTWRWAHGAGIGAADWGFFYRCYARTYAEHGNPPYLTPAFFEAMQRSMPQNWLLFTASREGRDIATSLIAIDALDDVAQHPPGSSAAQRGRTAWGRYWGALERVDSLHFEACYYQPLQWCIEQGYQRFEGGAQGEHKMARGLLPVATPSAHWLAHPQFAAAVAHFLQRESAHLSTYQSQLALANPFKNRDSTGP